VGRLLGLKPWNGRFDSSSDLIIKLLANLHGWMWLA